MKKILTEYRPFFSVLIIITSLFTFVFCKMELRRKGYSLLKTARYEKSLSDSKRLQVMAFAKLTRPDRIESIAQSKLALNRATEGQIVQMTGYRVTLRQ